MIFMTTYKLKPFLTNDQRRKLLDVFGKAGVPAGTTAHYVAADGSLGVVLVEADDAEEAYANIQNYLEWVEYDSKVMLTIEQALPHITAALG
jgi:hypothetical protein